MKINDILGIVTLVFLFLVGSVVGLQKEKYRNHEKNECVTKRILLLLGLSQSRINPGKTATDNHSVVTGKLSSRTSSAVRWPSPLFRSVHDPPSMTTSSQIKRRQLITTANYSFSTLRVLSVHSSLLKGCDSCRRCIEATYVSFSHHNLTTFVTHCTFSPFLFSSLNFLSKLWVVSVHRRHSMSNFV